MVNTSSRNDSKNVALKHITYKSKKVKKIHTKSENSISYYVGNSCLSSSQLRFSSELTITKKRHRKEMEDSKLNEIAKLLSEKAKKNKRKS